MRSDYVCSPSILSHYPCLLAGASVLITADIAVRGGRALNLKKTVDEALTHAPSIQTVLVDAREGPSSKAAMQHPRDIFLHDAEKTDTSSKDVIEYVDSNHPLFILYTSGSTGKPKGLVHTSANYLLYTMITQQVRPECYIYPSWLRTD